MRSPINLFTAVCTVTYVLRKGVSADCPFGWNESGIGTLMPLDRSRKSIFSGLLVDNLFTRSADGRLWLSYSCSRVVTIEERL